MNDKIRISDHQKKDPLDDLFKNVMLLSFGLDFKIISANPLFLDKLSCSAQDLAGLRFDDDLCRETPDYVRDEIAYLIKQGKLWQGNLLISNFKQSVPAWYSGTIVPIEDDAKELIGYTLMANKGKTQQDLISSHDSTESWMKAIFNSPEEANILVNRDGEVITFNAKASSFMEWYTHKEIKTEELIWQYFNKSFSKTFQALFDKCRNGQSQKFIKSFRNASGYTKIVNIELRPVISQKNEIMGVIMVVSDISQEVALENRIRLSEKKLDEIAFINAHEVRAPLASILGLLNLLDFEEVSASNKQILSYLKAAANDLELVIHKVTENTYLDNE